jgi:hypothetical protein
VILVIAELKNADHVAKMFGKEFRLSSEGPKNGSNPPTQN